MTPKPITDLEELQNIVILGLEVWFVANDSELVRLERLELKQGTNGLILHPWNSSSRRVHLLGIYDPTFKHEGPYQQLGRIFDNIEDARTHSNDAFYRRDAIIGLLKIMN